MKINEIVENAKKKLNPEQAEMLLDIVNHKIKRAGIFIALYDIDTWGLTVSILPELEQILDAHKELIIKRMLKSIKANDHGLEDTEQVLSRLEHTGINWLELAIIRRSLDIEQGKNINRINEASIVNTILKKGN